MKTKKKSNCQQVIFAYYFIRTSVPRKNVYPPKICFALFPFQMICFQIAVRRYVLIIFAEYAIFGCCLQHVWIVTEVDATYNLRMAVRSRSVRLFACLLVCLPACDTCFGSLHTVSTNGIHAIARPRTKGNRHTLQCVAYRNENRIGDWLWCAATGVNIVSLLLLLAATRFDMWKLCQEFVSHRCVIIVDAKRSIGIQFGLIWCRWYRHAWTHVYEMGVSAHPFDTCPREKLATTVTEPSPKKTRVKDRTRDKLLTIFTRCMLTCLNGNCTCLMNLFRFVSIVFFDRINSNRLHRVSEKDVDIRVGLSGS